MEQTCERLNVYDFSDIGSFLKALYSNKKRQDQGLTYESWSSELGYKSRSFLKMIVNGDRKPSRDFMDRLCDSEGIAENERQYLFLLVRYANVEFEDEKKDLCDRMIELRGAIKSLKGVPQDEFLTNPDLPKLHLLTGFTGFKRHTQELARLMGLDVSLIEQHLESLLRLGMVKKEKDEWIAVENSFRIPQNLGQSALRKYHEASAKESILAQDIEQSLRKFRSLLFAATEENLSILNEEINRFAHRVLERFDTSSLEEKRLYKLNLNYYPVTPLVHKSENTTGLSEGSSVP